eukprot:6491405-Amphidinium_carterae.2
MQFSSWGDIAENIVEEQHHGENVVHASSASSWGDVAEPIEDEPSCGLRGWADAAEEVDVTSAGSEDALALLERPLVLSDYAEPVSRRRGRPLQFFAAKGQPQANLVSEREAVQDVVGEVQSVSGPASITVVESTGRTKIDFSALKVPHVTSFIRPAQHGHRPLSVCSLALQSAMEKFAGGAPRLDHDFLKLKTEYVDKGLGFHSCSLAVRSESLGINEAELLRKLLIYAAGEWIYSKLQRALLEQCVASALPQPDLLCYIEFLAFDETPLHTRVIDVVEGGSKLLQWTTGMARQKESGTSSLLTVCNDSPSMKVLQVRQLYAMIFRTPTGSCTIFGETPTPLAALEKNSGRVTSEALSRLAATSNHCESFNLKTRMCSMDKHAANLSSEASTISSRPSWNRLDNLCEIHTTARAFRKTFDGLVPQHISGILHIALALRAGAAMVVFRRCLVTEIKEKLKVYYGPPPEAARLYREKLMSLFWTAGSKLLVHRMLLSKLPNGMWSESDEVQLYLPLAKQGQIDKAAVSKSIEAALMFVLTGTKPHLFPRHRWTGSDLSVEELGRVECIHKLLTATWRRFMVANSKLHRGTAAPALEVLHGMQHNAEVSASGLDSLNASGLLAVNMDSSEVLESIVTSAGAEKERSADMHAQDRQKGHDWLRSDQHSPLSMLILLRVTMQPL